MRTQAKETNVKQTDTDRVVSALAGRLDEMEKTLNAVGACVAVAGRATRWL